MLSDVKMIICGSVFELFQYDKQFEIKELRRRQTSFSNPSVSLRRIVNANSGQWFDEDKMQFYNPLFLTLTFAENVQDLSTANAVFTKFVKRVNYGIFDGKDAKLCYVAVPEFQRRGAVHYHCIFFNVPFVDNFYSVFSDLWGYGFINIKSLSDFRGVGWYIAKYLGKGGDDERLKGRKKFFCSRNVIKPYVSYDLRQTLDFVESIGSPFYDVRFKAFDGSGIHYRVYDISEHPLSLLVDGS